jgi:hypothetical protein
MDCGVCLEDKILQKDIIFFRCSHNICKECYVKLMKRLCPFCRKKIKIFSDKNSKQPKEYYNETDDEDYYNYIYTDDFVIPRLRPDHQAYRRQKKEKKKQNLEKILNTFKQNRYFKLIPNIKNKKNKKLLLFFI